MCSAVTKVSSRVRLLEVSGLVFGCFLVAGRVFGCYKSLAVRSAVTIFGRVVSCYKRWPYVRPFQVLVSSGFVIFFILLFLHFSTCLGLCPFIFSSRAFVFLMGPSVLFMHVFSHAHIFSRSFAFLLHLLRAYSALFSSGFFVFFCFPRSLGVCFLAFLRLSVKQTSLSSLCLVFSPLGIVVFNWVNFLTRYCSLVNLLYILPLWHSILTLYLFGSFLVIRFFSFILFVLSKTPLTPLLT